jgi:hypothetical protein
MGEHLLLRKLNLYTVDQSFLFYSFFFPMGAYSLLGPKRSTLHQKVILEIPGEGDRGVQSIPSAPTHIAETET